MAKNRKSNSGTSTSSNNTDYTKSNNAILQPLIDELKKEMEGEDEGGLFRKKYQVQMERIQSLLDYCNENNLEISTADDGHDYHWLYLDQDHPLLSVIDHETGRTYNFFNEDYVNYKETLENARDTLATLPSSMTDNIEKVLIGTLPHAMGRFSPGYPNSILLNYRYGDGGEVWNTRGIIGTVVHEAAHNYDYNVLHGFDDEVNTIFNKYGYMNKNVGPCDYATTTPGETISTTFEMVYTKRVRTDANMKNGDTIMEAFYNKYERAPDFSSSADNKKMYEMWYEEWSDITVPTEQILNGGHL